MSALISGAVSRLRAELAETAAQRGAERFGGVVDGVTDDTAALAAIVAEAQPFNLTGKSAYQHGTTGPASGTVNRADHATIGSAEVLANGGFAGSAAGWALANFAYSAGAIAHAAGTVGTAAQAVTTKAFRHYLISITVTTTTPGAVDLQHAGMTMLDDTGYYMLSAGAATLTFPWLSAAAATADFRVITDAAWAGSVDALSMIEVADEMPLSIVNVPTDDSTLRIPNGAKFGRFNAGVVALGDRQTMALAGPAAVWNIAIGPRSLQGNIEGFENTAVGAFAGRWTLTSRNTYFGYSAGKYNTRGEYLTGLGFKALGANTSGNRNTGVGHHASLQNTSGSDNTAMGWQALYNGLTTSGNTAVGSQCAMNARGTENTYFGALAGYLDGNTNVTYSYSFGTMIGAETAVYGENGTAVGFAAKVGANGAPVNNSMALGSGAQTKLASTAKIGAGLSDVNLSGRLHYKQPSGSEISGAGTVLSLANFMSAVLSRFGPGAPFNDTTPAAAAIVAAIPGCEVGTGFELYYRNTTAAAMTLIAGAGITLEGTTTVQPGQTRLFKVIATNVGAGTEAVAVFGVGSMAN